MKPCGSEQGRRLFQLLWKTGGGLVPSFGLRGRCAVYARNQLVIRRQVRGCNLKVVTLFPGERQQINVDLQGH